MKHALIALLILVVAAPATAGLYDTQRLNTLYKMEINGIRAYDDGDYKTAFKYLSDTASKGLKESQYLLSIMFMQGQGTNKSILFGLAWLGVACESGNEEWQKTFDTMYQALNTAQRSMVDEKIKAYAEKYGSDTQGVTCAKRTAVGSRNFELRCAKSQGTYPDYDIELALTR
ncbi:MAG: sel1 repeat family protein [Gammaproteobacteria bacterium]|nr:MAG: sel1 repeat family protein [Gammaproteobacteria bacterium]